jgi:hypothetical protein
MHDERIDELVALPSALKLRFFAELCHNLTVGLRTICSSLEASDSVLTQARSLNEILHMASGYLTLIVSGREDPRRLKLVAETLLSPSDPFVNTQIRLSWEYAMKAAISR